MLNRKASGMRRILYTLCFFLFCLIDQRIKTGSGLDGVIETFRALTGVVMALLILPQYSGEDWKQHRMWYLLWSVAGVAGGILFVIKGQPVMYFANARVVMALDVLLWGWILIHTGILLRRGTATAAGAEDMQNALSADPGDGQNASTVSLRGGQSAPAVQGGRDRLFGLAWLVMLGLMCVSRSEYHWPALYLIMFGCFYLTDYTESQREDLFQGMLNGIILAFFVLQGWCFVFRPYDETRYLGAYNNSNLNALFYLVVLAAVLAKLICGRMRWFYWAGTGALLGFLFMTVSRTGWASAAALVLVGMAFLTKSAPGKRAVLTFLKNCVAAVLCAVLLFPAVFAAVRYLPPVFHHPVWFYGEWSEDKVHSWDPWDSEKYVNIDRLMRVTCRRFVTLAESVFPGAAESDSGTAVRSESVPADTPGASELQQQLYEEALAAGYALDPKDKNALTVRKAIYRYYIHLLNLTGHPESEQGFQMQLTQRIGHAHNIYLQWGVDFGIPAMLLFITLVVWTIVRLGRGSVGRPSGLLLLFLAPCIFGMLEYAWGAGSLTIALIFVVWRRMICNEC